MTGDPGAPAADGVTPEENIDAPPVDAVPADTAAVDTVAGEEPVVTASDVADDSAAPDAIVVA